MPKYFYFCEECKFSFKAYHSSKEILKNCPECATIDGLVRKVNKIYIKKQETSDSEKPIGELTKEHIEDNKSILKEYKEELLQNEFDNKNIGD